MNHTPECDKRTKQSIEDIERYKAKWPNHCNHCFGYGQFVYRYDPSPAGVALAPGWMEDVDPCPKCTEHGICARCGQSGLNFETGEGPCAHCGWNYDDGLPERIDDCGCHDLEPYWES